MTGRQKVEIKTRNSKKYVNRNLSCFPSSLTTTRILSPLLCLKHVSTFFICKLGLLQPTLLVRGHMMMMVPSSTSSELKQLSFKDVRTLPLPPQAIMFFSSVSVQPGFFGVFVSLLSSCLRYFLNYLKYFPAYLRCFLDCLKHFSVCFRFSLIFQ